MHPLRALAFVLALASGAACAQSRLPETAPDHDPARDVTAGSGTSGLAAPATMESRGLFLDTEQRAPSPLPSRGTPTQDCSGNAATSASGDKQAAGCAPAPLREQQPR